RVKRGEVLGAKRDEVLRTIRAKRDKGVGAKRDKVLLCLGKKICGHVWLFGVPNVMENRASDDPNVTPLECCSQLSIKLAKEIHKSTCTPNLVTKQNHEY
ncbi:hypothetical protein PIB30_105112, partial [Stylosanthes scabra]|nr:hypothetical protein [Stylosanthes scabra]